MDFNSNDEYLKAFPPNSGPKLGSSNILKQVTDVRVSKLHVKNTKPKMSIEKTHSKTLEPIYFDENIKCVEVQEVQVHPKIPRKKNGDLRNKDKGLVSNKEDLGGARDAFVSIESKNDELAHQIVILTPTIVSQRENVMELEEDSKLNIEIQATREKAMDSEASVIDDKDELFVTTYSSNKTKEHFKILVEDITSVHASLASKIIDHYKDENFIRAEGTTKKLIEEDYSPILSSLHNSGEKPSNLLNENTSTPDVDINKDCAMNVEILSTIQHGQGTIGVEVVDSNITIGYTPGKLEYVKSESKPSIEIYKNLDVIGEIGMNEPMSIEVIEETTSTTISKIQTIHNKLTNYTQIESKDFDVLDSLTKLETIDDFTSKAKNICERDEEESPLNRSDNNDIIRLDKDLGTSSDIGIDMIVDTIMIDIASIEADLEIEDKDVDFEARTIADYRNISSYEKPIEFHYKTTCQDQIQVDGAHS